ncbi:poly(ADP-ribose) glycohydrolase catalytic domain-containing protein [Streptomyces noursei]|uniref:hypothetical protein n=1 Tax=Streptomyces noursei TaxID=1971 RepID=UPI0038152A34
MLGAWECGVLRDEPAVVARAFGGLLSADGRFAGWFGRIVFAVPERRTDSPNRAAFAAVFPA